MAELHKYELYCKDELGYEMAPTARRHDHGEWCMSSQVEAALAAKDAEIKALQQRLSDQDLTMAGYINRERQLVAELSKLRCAAAQGESNGTA
jgi:hypothetical protein